MTSMILEVMVRYIFDEWLAMFPLWKNMGKNALPDKKELFSISSPLDGELAGTVYSRLAEVFIALPRMYFFVLYSAYQAL